jgi:HD-GYP domain-containing protein (c-di-GMP phosphodiesterase class II)
MGWEMTFDDVAGRTRWKARPVLAFALSVVVIGLPVLLSFLATLALAKSLVGMNVWTKVLVLGVVAIVVGLVAERALRRVLPLAALLRMTMLFPDHAPSRFAVARSAGSTRQLVERARSRPDESVGEAATRILGLVAALASHDRRTRGHSERVRVFTDVIAAELRLPNESRDRLRWAALLHDLGKLDVPTKILNKPAGLDADEWTVVRRHPTRGAELAGPLLDWLGAWGAAIEEHHERFDGLGYPRGLAGHDIALAGRVVAVADVFEVMTAARSYKRPMSVRAARRELATVAGTQLDPQCVRALLQASLPRVLWVVGPLSLLVNLPFLRSVAEVGRVVEQAGATAASQATTAAVAASAAVAVVAAPGVSAAEPSHPQPHPSSTSSSSSGRDPGNTASGTTTPGPSDAGTDTQPSTRATPTRSASDPTTIPNLPVASPSTSPTASPGGAATPSPSVSPTPAVSPTPTPTSTSSSGSSDDPATPVVVGPLLPVLIQPVTFVVTSLEPGVTFKCRVDGGQRKTCGATVSYSGLSKGKHRFEVYAENPDGRKSDTARWEFTVV